MGQIELDGFHDLDERLRALHDCPFDLRRARFDRGSAQWHGEFIRPLWDAVEAKHRRRFLVVLESHLPVVRASLQIRAVSEVEVNDDQGIGIYTLDRAEERPRGLRLSFNEALTIDLHCRLPVRGAYAEEPLDGVRAVYRLIFSVQTGPRLVESPSHGQP